MTNEELKKKIVEIIINAIWKDAEADYDSTDETEAGSIADALILEGIGYVWDITEKAEKAIASLIKQNKELQHRAARAERALRDELVQKTIRLGVTDICPWYIQALSEAEKELAEEMKDENI